jgi:hypothetical protein
MNAKIIIASGATLLLALGGSFAEARNIGGGGGGHMGGGGGAHFGGGGGGHFGGGGHMSARSFHGGSPSFGGGHARYGNRGFSRRGPSVGFNGDRHHGHGGHHRHHRGRVIVGSPYFYDDYDDYGYDYGYASDCGWLYQRAVQTGNQYWWRRYQDCEDEG